MALSLLQLTAEVTSYHFLMFLAWFALSCLFLSCGTHPNYYRWFLVNVVGAWEAGILCWLFALPWYNIVQKK